MSLWFPEEVIRIQACQSWTHWPLQIKKRRNESFHLTFYGKYLILPFSWVQNGYRNKLRCYVSFVYLVWITKLHIKIVYFKQIHWFSWYIDVLHTTYVEIIQKTKKISHMEAKNKLLKWLLEVIICTKKVIRVDVGLP